MQENKSFDWVGNCARLLTSQCSCQVLRKICIDNSTAYFTFSSNILTCSRLKVIANSLKKLLLTAKENHVVCYEVDK